jgi:nitrogen fixation/metabolism regulation signal transduction histidine kinase
MTALLVAALCAISAGLTAWGMRRRAAAHLDAAVACVRQLRAGEGQGARGPLAPLLREVDVLVSEMRRREMRSEHREQVMELVVEGCPSAIVLLTSEGDILLANPRARELFFDGRELVGQSFLDMLSRAPEALKRAMVGEGDELFSLEDAEGEPRAYHLAKRRLLREGEPTILVTVNEVTRELGRREVEVWKQVIRVIAHEVRNSLTPIATLAATGLVLARGAEREDKLFRLFETVKERSNHLRDFLDGYARFARLPRPARKRVRLRDLAARIETLWPEACVEGDLDAEDGWFDLAQVEQLLLNVLKNAREAGSEETTVLIDGRDPLFVRLQVADRGHGMPAEVMKRALLPLFSTKVGGAGLGLSLCREIAEAHGGVLRLEGRDGGGLVVSVRIPREPRAGGARGALTLSRGGT